MGLQKNRTVLQKSMEKTGFTVMSCNFDHDRLCYILEIWQWDFWWERSLVDDIRDRRSGCGTDHRDRRLPYFFQMCTAAVSCVFCGASFPEKPMIEKEFEATLRNLFLNDHRQKARLNLYWCFWQHLCWRHLKEETGHCFEKKENRKRGKKV